MVKTQAKRILDANKITYSVWEYDASGGALSGVQVADVLGVEPERVFKTLVTNGKKEEIIVFVVPGNVELNLKKAAIAAGEKQIEMLKSKELKPKTGYEHGGCSPVGMIKHYTTYVDETALLHETILVSAGRIGTQIEIAPSDLAAFVNARFCELF